MKPQNKFIISLLVCASTLIISCSKDSNSTGDSSFKMLTFNFTQNFDGVDVSSSNFNQFDFVNQNNDTLSISNLRYLISGIKLFKLSGDTFSIDGYQLVDVTNNTGLTFSPTNVIPPGYYSGISITFGFDSLNNLGNYADLNSASWNWPTMLGGGYHFMQMEGKYKEMGNDSLYAYHMGTARPSMGVFEQNYFTVDLGAINIFNDAAIEIKMNIAEWYKNPNTWDLNTMHSTLMPNYNAQIQMNQNGHSVFSLGAINQ